MDRQVVVRLKLAGVGGYLILCGIAMRVGEIVGQEVSVIVHG